MESVSIGTTSAAAIATARGDAPESPRAETPTAADGVTPGESTGSSHDELNTMADVVEAVLPPKPKLSGDDLPKMAEFLPDIQARIESLKKPTKNQKSKKGKNGDLDGAEECVLTGG